MTDDPDPDDVAGATCIRCRATWESITTWEADADAIIQAYQARSPYEDYIVEAGVDAEIHGTAVLRKRHDHKVQLFCPACQIERRAAGYREANLDPTVPRHDHGR